MNYALNVLEGFHSADIKYVGFIETKFVAKRLSDFFSCDDPEFFSNSQRNHLDLVRIDIIKDI